MHQSSIETLLETHGDRLYRLCLVMLGSAQDAEDALQETMLKYLQKAPVFADPEHEKAWLLKVAANQCRDILRFRSRHSHVSLESLELPSQEQDHSILEALMSLPEKYRIVLILHYVEGYSAADIAPMIKRTPSAVKMRLQKGRTLLKERYRKEYL